MNNFPHFRDKGESSVPSEHGVTQQAESVPVATEELETSSAGMLKRTSWVLAARHWLSSKIDDHKRKKLDAAIQKGAGQLAAIASDAYAVLQRGALEKCLSSDEVDESFANIESHRSFFQKSLTSVSDLVLLSPNVAEAVTKFRSICNRHKEFVVAAEMVAHPSFRLKNMLSGFEELFQGLQQNGTCDAQTVAILFDQLSQYAAAFQRARSRETLDVELGHRHAHNLLNGLYVNLMNTYQQAIKTQPAQK